MSVEKTYNEFVVLHEKKLMSKDVDNLENSIISATKRTSEVIGTIAENDIDEATNKMIEGINMFKKILVKHKLYDL